MQRIKFLPGKYTNNPGRHRISLRTWKNGDLKEILCSCQKLIKTIHLK